MLRFTLSITYTEKQWDGETIEFTDSIGCIDAADVEKEMSLFRDTMTADIAIVSIDLVKNF